MFDTGVVLFAIRSALRLGQQVRQAYVDSTKSRELVLPLPSFPSSPDFAGALNWFRGDGIEYAKQSPEVEDLLRRCEAGTLGAEERRFVVLYVEQYALDLAKRGMLGQAADGSILSADDLNACLTIRQWQRGKDPNPPVIRRLAGTFIEIGVDYFQNVPGALNKDSAHGKAVAGFLDAMSEIRFSEVELRDVPTRLFVATLDSLSENPALLSGDAKVVLMVRTNHGVS